MTEYANMAKRARRAATQRVLQITKKEYLDAVREGIRCAVEDRLPSATAWIGAMTATWERLLPDRFMLKEAVVEGICRSMPYEEDMVAAIAERKAQVSEATPSSPTEDTKAVRGWRRTDSRRKVKDAQAVQRHDSGRSEEVGGSS